MRISYARSKSIGDIAGFNKELLAIGSEAVPRKVYDKLSESRAPFEPAVRTRIPLSTPARVAQIRGLAGLWSDLQGGDVAQASTISGAEWEDALLACFILTTQGAEETGYRSGEQPKAAVLARVEEYLCAHLTHPV